MLLGQGVGGANLHGILHGRSLLIRVSSDVVLLARELLAVHQKSENRSRHNVLEQDIINHE